MAELKEQTPVQKINELLGRIDPLIDRCNNLYNQFATGVELRPPVELRKQLEQLIDQVQKLAKPTPTLRFRVASELSRFITMKDKWDRMLRDIESGKIKPIVPRRK